MFKTISTRTFPFISGASPEISKTLGCMSLGTHSQVWFVLVCEVTTNALVEQAVLMFSSADQVVETFAQSAQVIGVKQATIVSPPAINQSSDWKYEPLVEIARGRHEKTGDIHLIFLVENGARYLERQGETTVNELIGVVPVVKFKTPTK